MNDAPLPAATGNLLQQARQAIARRDLLTADAAFVQHLQGTRGDGSALAEYGDFCLRTGRHAEACYLLWKAARSGHGDTELWARLGHARWEVGDHSGARSAFAVALQHDGNHPVALHGMAMCLQHEKRWQEAVRALEAVLATQPDNLPLWVELAIACGHAGDRERARTLFARAERMAPGDPNVLLESGRSLREAGDFERACVRLQQSARIWPSQPPILLELAQCQRALGKIDAALATLDVIAQIAPNLPECHAERGYCLAATGDIGNRDLHWNLACATWSEQRRFDQVAPLVASMLAADPDGASAWNAQGSLFDLQQDIAAAEAAYRRAITSDADAMAPHVNLGNILETSNRLSEALQHANIGIALASKPENAGHPAIPGAHLLRAKIARRQKQYDIALHHLSRVGQQASDKQQQTALFEKAKIFDLQGQTDAAMATFAQANAIAVLEPGVDDPDGNKFARGVDYLLGLVERGWLESWSLPPRDPAPDEPPPPVFLLGFPRSGTTLLNTVLFSHSAITVLEEKQTFSEALGLARHMPGGYPHALPGCDALDARLLRETYWQAVAKECTVAPGQLLIDKFPFYLTLAGLIHVAFPNAKFVFAQRHPCDAVLSCFMQNFRLNEGMANFRTLADTASIYDRTMRLWQAFRERLHLNVHTVRYEGMVEDFDGEVRSLCDFLGVSWEESLRQFSRKALDRGKINTPSYEQVSRPIYRESRYRWQRYRTFLEPHLPLLQPWIERYGYAHTDAG